MARPAAGAAVASHRLDLPAAHASRRLQLALAFATFGRRDAGFRRESRFGAELFAVGIDLLHALDVRLQFADFGALPLDTGTPAAGVFGQVFRIVRAFMLATLFVALASVAVLEIVVGDDAAMDHGAMLFMLAFVFAGGVTQIGRGRGR